jgi:hypothetical protein
MLYFDVKDDDNDLFDEIAKRIYRFVITNTDIDRVRLNCHGFLLLLSVKVGQCFSKMP